MHYIPGILIVIVIYMTCALSFVQIATRGINYRIMSRLTGSYMNSKAVSIQNSRDMSLFCHNYNEAIGKPEFEDWENNDAHLYDYVDDDEDDVPQLPFQNMTVLPFGILRNLTSFKESEDEEIKESENEEIWGMENPPYFDEYFQDDEDAAMKPFTPSGSTFIPSYPTIPTSTDFSDAHVAKNDSIQVSTLNVHNTKDASDLKSIKEVLFLISKQLTVLIGLFVLSIFRN